MKIGLISYFSQYFCNTVISFTTYRSTTTSHRTHMMIANFILACGQQNMRHQTKSQNYLNSPFRELTSIKTKSFGKNKSLIFLVPIVLAAQTHTEDGPRLQFTKHDNTLLDSFTIPEEEAEGGSELSPIYVLWSREI